MPLNAQTLQAVTAGKEVFEITRSDDEPLLVYSRLVTMANQESIIIQVARSLTDQVRFLNILRLFLFTGSVIAIAVAFGVGWVMAGLTLKPIHRITQTAQDIGAERDFDRRVDHTGPNDEIGQLAFTFNNMLTELQAAFLQTDQSLQAQRRFVADASHELRTPLTTIRGNLDLLQREPPIPDADRVEILADMVDETERLMRLVSDLLTLARLDTQRELRREPVSLKNLLGDVCRRHQLLSPDRPIACDSLPDVTVWGDEDGLKQIFHILLDNAVKHTPPDAGVRLTMATQDDQVCITVSDEGPGITPQKVPHLFDRFYRGDPARTGKGAGLGLAIARELVETHGGVISVDSEAGAGTSFIVTLPVKNDGPV